MGAPKSSPPLAEHVLAICGSMRFIDEMEAIGREIAASGWTVFTPQREEAGESWDALSTQDRLRLKKAYIDAHLARIRQSTAVLIANYSKDGVSGYIGANSLMEAAFAYALGIPVHFLLPIGEQGVQVGGGEHRDGHMEWPVTLRGPREVAAPCHPPI